MRMKMFASFLQNVPFKNDVTIPNRPNLPKFHYKIEFNDPNKVNEIEYENYHYEIAKPEISPFADALFNEMFPFWRTLWRCRGGHMWAEHTFEITDDGKWKARSWIKFKQPPANWNPPDPLARRSPFFAQDYSRYQINTAKRARLFAKPKWGDEGRTHDEFMWLLNEEKILNQVIDFTFEHVWEDEGDWSDVENYRIEIPGGDSWKMEKAKVAKQLPAEQEIQFPIKKVV
jgi:hypothetical protein